MADNKSREDFVNVIHQCLECGNHHVFENGVDGNVCDYCDGQLKARGLTNLPITKEKYDIGAFAVTADVSDALKGLKAVQREARKATQALKEFDLEQKRIELEKADYPITPNDVRESLGLKRLGGDSSER